MYPIPTIICTVIIVIAYIILSGNIPMSAKNFGIRSFGREQRRREALASARLYLAPYRDMWKDQKLSNKYCSLQLGANGYTITGQEQTNGIYNRSFRIITCEEYSREDLWDLFLSSFSRNITYDKLLELCDTFHARYKETKPEVTINKSVQQNTQNNTMPVLEVPELNREKIDVNNASEVELTSLPGISIVIAKKLIKKREELNGFKNVNEVCSFLKLRPHMESQLKDLICVKRMKGSDKIKRYNERNIDL